MKEEIMHRQEQSFEHEEEQVEDKYSEIKNN